MVDASWIQTERDKLIVVIFSFTKSTLLSKYNILYIQTIGRRLQLCLQWKVKHRYQHLVFTKFYAVVVRCKWLKCEDSHFKNKRTYEEHKTRPRRNSSYIAQLGNEPAHIIWNIAAITRLKNIYRIIRVNINSEKMKITKVTVINCYCQQMNCICFKGILGSIKITKHLK